MLTDEAIIQAIQTDSGIESVKVFGDGYHYKLVVVGDVFLGLSKLKRQQWVYSKLKNWIASGELHALTIQSWTKEEWEKNSG